MKGGPLMRVCMLTTSYPRWPGDPAGSFVASLAEQLADGENIELEVFAPGIRERSSQPLAASVPVRRLRYFWPASWQRLAYGSGIPWNLRHSPIAWLNLPGFLIAFALATLRGGRRSDLIHAHWGPLAALAVLLRPLHRRPVVLTTHGSDLRTPNPLIRRITEFAVRRAAAVVTPSPEFEARCRQVRGQRRICEFLPHGVSAPPRNELEIARESAGRSGAGLELVTVGRLVPERRHELLLRVVARLKRERPGTRLTIVGDGPERAQLEGVVGQLGLRGTVELVGSVPTTAVPRYLTRAHVYVSPTTIDNFATAVVEAAAHALPVVATRVGFPLTLVVDGETGRLVDPDDEDGLLEAILDVSSAPDRIRQMGWAMHRRLDDLDLTWPACSRRLAEIYREIVRPEDPGAAGNDG